jgi:Co/Zn/Cd efflux system component
VHVERAAADLLGRCVERARVEFLLADGLSIRDIAEETGIGDANMRSAWICTRNDVLGNLAVLLAALGVFGTGTGWPDVVVAAIMAGLALQGAWTVIRQSVGELRRPAFSVAAE